VRLTRIASNLVEIRENWVGNFIIFTQQIKIIMISFVLNFKRRKRKRIIVVMFVKIRKKREIRRRRSFVKNKRV